MIGATEGRRRGVASPAAWVGVAILLFVALSVWWLLYDRRAPGAGDPGRHLMTAHWFADHLRDWDLLEPLTFDGYFGYPPLARLVGAIPVLFGLPARDWSPIALNLVFAPVLALGCYLTGRLVFNRRAGVLAAVFALGSPMIMQLFHIDLLDAPLAAMVAITVWALLASDGFSRRRESVLAGAFLGLAMLVKTPAPLFVLGIVAVLLARGGWRQWRNLALMAAAALVVAGPFYLIHLDYYLSLTQEATVASQDPWTRSFGWSFEGTSRFGPESLVWYLWAAVNTQYLLPLLGFFVVGLVASVRQIRTRPYLPELLAGLVVGYLAMTFLSLHDPRYTLPLVVYVAVIGTGWIATSARSWVVRLGTAALLAVVALNVAAGSLGLLSRAQIAFPGDDPDDLIHPGALTVFDKRGYVTGEPRPDDTWDRLFTAMDEGGMDTASLRLWEVPFGGIDMLGFEVLAKDWGFKTRERDPDVRIFTWWTSDHFYLNERGMAPPCAVVEEGMLPDAVEGIEMRVVAYRREGDHYTQWCDWAGGPPDLGDGSGEPES